MPPLAGKNLLAAPPPGFALSFPTLAELSQVAEPAFTFEEGPEAGLYFEVGSERYLVVVESRTRCSQDWMICQGVAVTGPERCYRIGREEWMSEFLKLLPGGPGRGCEGQTRCCGCPPHLPC
jgi:hypothetical protein